MHFFMRVFRMPRLLGVILLLGFRDPCWAEPVAKYVVVIALDGCRPEALQKATGPNLKELVTTGASTWKAQAVEPTVTQVNFASIFTGVLPVRHGIDHKEWSTGERPKLAVPTLLDAMADGGLKVSAFLGHEKLYPAETSSTNKAVHFEYSPYEAKAVAPVAARHLREQQPQFCFIYMGDLDGAGHKYGWLSPEQLARMDDIDAAIGMIVRALKESGMWASTLLLLTADHGGHGKSHSAGTVEDATVPWIAFGPLVKPGEIKAPVSNMDTLVTAAWALGIPVPGERDGKVIKDVFP